MARTELTRASTTDTSYASTTDTSYASLELGPSHFTVELSGDPDRLSGFIAALAPFGKVTSLRSGTLALE